MKAGGGKSKGSSFERLISKHLSEWYSEGKRSDLFWRTQNSGGRSTMRFKRGLLTENQDGDVSSVSDESKLFSSILSIECKHYSTVHLWSLISGKKDGLLSFWDQAFRQAKNAEKIPCLIVRENYRPTLFITSNELYSELLTICSVEPRLIAKIKNQPDLFIYDLERDILKIEPKLFKEMLKSIFKSRTK
jgi:hypothetical protein